MKKTIAMILMLAILFAFSVTFALPASADDSITVKDGQFYELYVHSNGTLRIESGGTCRVVGHEPIYVHHIYNYGTLIIESGATLVALGSNMYNYNTGKIIINGSLKMEFNNKSGSCSGSITLNEGGTFDITFMRENDAKSYAKALGVEPDGTHVYAHEHKIMGNKCSSCGKTICEIEGHVYENGACRICGDCQHLNCCTKTVCEDCGAVIEEEITPPGGGAPGSNFGGTEYETETEESNPDLLLMIIIGVGGIALGSLFTVIIMKRKKSVFASDEIGKSGK